MATHASLTGADLHEPKGVAAATNGQVYVANGAGSGSWSQPFVTTASLNNANKAIVNFRIDDISTAASHWLVFPIAGDIDNIYCVIDGAITAADCVLSFEIAGTAITDGNITITQVGSAAGDVDSSTPSAAKTVTAGQALEIITNGGSTGTVAGTLTFVLNTA